MWKTRDADPHAANRVARELGLPHAVGCLLAGRGYATPAEAEHFLNPRLSDLSDPFDLTGLEAATTRIREAIGRGAHIVVFGDYDVDGITATALLVSVLTRLGAEATPFLPNRLDDGYGLRPETVTRCIDTCRPDLIVTVDCGTCSGEAVALAASRGVPVIVTDHHELSGDPASAEAVINPKIDGRAETMFLAGVGVAFKLCHGLVKRGMKEGASVRHIDLRDWLDLVALGTIADVAPLRHENRILVRHGLTRLCRDAGGDALPPHGLGLRRLARVARVKPPIHGYHVAFMLGPRLNAAGRLGTAETALSLLLSDDPAEVDALAQSLDDSNRERRRIEKEILETATAELDETFDADRDFGIVLGREQWHAGAIGLVASRLVSRFNRPAIVISLDEVGQGRGSCRSIEELDILAVLEECADCLTGFGGHQMAAGLTLESSRLEEFRSRFNAGCAQRLSGVDLRPVQSLDAWIDLQEVDEALLAALDRMRPFGAENPAPVWGIGGVQPVGQPRTVGRDHLKMTVASGGSQVEAIAFGMARRPVPDGPLDLACRLRRETYRGTGHPELHVADFRPALRA